MNSTKSHIANEIDSKLDELIKLSVENCRSNPQAALNNATEVFEQSEINSHKRAQSLVCSGSCKVWLGNYDEALKDLFESIESISEFNDPKFESIAFYHLFCTFYFLADYDNALKYAYEMLYTSEKNNDQQAQANAYNGLGTVLYTTGENEKAIEKLTNGLTLALKTNDKQLLARIYDGIGTSYFNLNNVEKSIEFKQKSLDEARSVGSKQIESFGLEGLAKVHLNANDFKKAEALFKECLSIREELNFKFGISETNLNLGKLYLQDNALEKAKTYLTKALDIASEINSKEVIYKTHEALSMLYEKELNNEKFIEHFKNYYSYKEDFFSEKNKQRLKGVEMQFNIAQIENEKELLSKKNNQLELLSNDLVVLSDLGKTIISQLSVESINNTVYNIINGLMDAPGFGIGVISDDLVKLNFPGYIENGIILDSSGYDLTDNNRLAVVCYNKELEIVINNFNLEVNKYIQVVLKPIIGESVKSIIYLPLKIANKKIGVLTVQSFKENAFSDYHVNIVKNLAVYCAIAIENATLYEKQEERVVERTKEIIKQKEEIEKSYENTRLLAEIGQQIISTVNFESIFNSLHENICKLMNAECFGVRIYHPDKNEIEYRYEIEKGVKDTMPFFVSMDNIDNFSVWCVTYNKEIFINDNLSEYQKYTSKIVVPSGDMPHSLIFCPMVIGDRILGVITVQSFEKFAYKPLHIDILKTLGTYTAIALENASLVENLEVKVIERTKEIVKQKEIIEESNKHITDSIKYAKRIQDAFLPSEKNITDCFKNSFVFYKPKDIVSGDFYWFEKKENKILFAVVDCTGHGVPGAFMSIIGFNGLNQIVNEYNYTQPSEILNQLNKNISNTLSQTVEDSKIRDGMDIALCSIDLETKKLEFAGAFSPLFLIRNNELIKFKGDKHPIGHFINEVAYTFTNNEIDLKSGDKIYIFSDGFVDQFGGASGKKLKYNYFRQLLLDQHQKPMQEQKIAITAYFEEWRNGYEQIDDVCLIGISI